MERPLGPRVYPAVLSALASGRLFGPEALLGSPAAVPELIEPEAFEPKVFEPEAFEPEKFEPEVFEPEAVEPEAIGPREPEAIGRPGLRVGFGPGKVEPTAKFEPRAAGLPEFGQSRDEPRGTEPRGTEPGSIEPSSAEPRGLGSSVPRGIEPGKIG